MIKIILKTFLFYISRLSLHETTEFAKCVLIKSNGPCLYIQPECVNYKRQINLRSVSIIVRRFYIRVH